MKRLCRLAQCCAGTGDPGIRDAHTLKQVQTHEHIVFHDVVEQLKGRVFSVSYALLADASQADVAAQKVFARLYHTGAYVAQQHDLVKYIYRLVIDQCFVELRMRRLRKLFSCLSRAKSIPDLARIKTDTNRERTLVVRGLSKLPDVERALLVLKEVADQSVEEIAEIMCLAPPVVRRRLFAARQSFRTEVAAE